MEELRKTDLAVIMKEKGRCISSRSLLVRVAAYNTVRAWIILTFHQINTVGRKMKRRRMARLTNTPGEYYGCRLNPDYSSHIYMTELKEA